MSKTLFPNVACVGMHFRGAQAQEIVALLDETSVLSLEREPENPYDAYAIKVIFSDIHIGYIERGQAAWISPLLDEGNVASVKMVKKEIRRNNLHPILDITVSKEGE